MEVKKQPLINNLLEITMNLEINKNLFAAWCGMIVSGCDLFGKEDKEISCLCDEIKAKLYNDSIAKHFAFSKTNMIECNPYYPRASNLSVYCFYLDKPIDEYYAFLDYCGDKEHRNIEFQKWIEISKYHINAIITNDAFSEVFNHYRNIIHRQFNDIDNQIRFINDKLEKHNLLTDVEIIFAPNLLQSKYLADYVLADNKLYVIAADFSEKTVIHEYLHIVSKTKQKEFEKLLQKNNIDDLLNVDEMQKLGYLKDFSRKSKIHALEEQFVRENTALLSN